MAPAQQVHIDLDGAWPPDSLDALPTLDCRSWGPSLRYSAPARVIEEFYDFVRGKMGAFNLFGSGDFHHLSALWLRQFSEPVALVTFDNHPDWDIRPPRWCCGTWINRALELPAVRSVAIWGCGNFELNWPGNLFVNRKELRARRLEIWPWTERLKASGRRRWPGMSREDWREKFAAFACRLAGKNAYVTVDLDCLAKEEATTNWEQGVFQIADLEWALGELRAHTPLVGGDLCGAYTPPRYARWRQRIEARLDHPRAEPVDAAAATARNLRARDRIWAALTAGHQHDAGADQKDAEA